MQTTAPESSKLAPLANERYVAITTFRRDGAPVSTPVWVVSDDPHRLLIATGADTWKVRRIKRNPNVRVAGCSPGGAVHGDAVDGIARLVDEESLVRSLQHEKYGWQMRTIESLNALLRWVGRGKDEQAVFIEVVED
jgi:hypothetical protein